VASASRIDGRYRVRCVSVTVLGNQLRLSGAGLQPSRASPAYINTPDARQVGIDSPHRLYSPWFIRLPGSWSSPQSRAVVNCPSLIPISTVWRPLHLWNPQQLHSSQLHQHNTPLPRSSSVSSILHFLAPDSNPLRSGQLVSQLLLIHPPSTIIQHAYQVRLSHPSGPCWQLLPANH
jgi:hypothetical protein